MCDLSNPKTAIVSSSIIPQFLDRSAGQGDVLVLGGGELETGCGITILALELVTERPSAGEAYVRTRLAMQRILAEDGRPAGDLHIAFAGFDAAAFGALQQDQRPQP